MALVGSAFAWRRATGERKSCWCKRGVSLVSGMIGGYTDKQFIPQYRFRLQPFRYNACYFAFGPPCRLVC